MYLCSPTSVKSEPLRSMTHAAAVKIFYSHDILIKLTAVLAAFWYAEKTSQEAG